MAGAPIHAGWPSWVDPGYGRGTTSITAQIPSGPTPKVVLTQQFPRALYRFRQHGAYQRAGSLITPALRQRGFDLCAGALIDLHRRGIRQPDGA